MCIIAKTMIQRSVVGLFVHIFGITVSVALALPQEDDSERTAKNPSDVRARIERRETEKSDELLFQLEADYLALLQASDYPANLLKAEEYLRLTDNASNWILYKNATEILLRGREKAAVPLLLRYVVIHSKRSSSHIVVKSLESTLATLTDRMFAFDTSGKDLESRNRTLVAKVVEDWWNMNKDKLDISGPGLSKEQLTLVLGEMLKKVGYGESNFRNDGEPLTAYRAQALLSYSMSLRKDYGVIPLTLVDERMTPMLLKQFDGKGAFPWDAAWMLGALRNESVAKELDDIALDESKASRVRLAAIIAMYVAREGMKTELLQKLLKQESNNEDKLIAITGLGFGKADVIPDLLRELKSPKIEHACAAMYGLARFAPKEAIPILESRHGEFTSGYPLLALCDLLSKYKDRQGRGLMVRMLQEALNRKDDDCLSRLLYAFATSCEQRDWVHAGANTNNYPLQCRAALKWYAEFEKETERRRENLEIALRSQTQQLEVSKKIEELRKGELKRLLILQGERVVTNLQSQEAETLLNQANTEVKKHTAAVQSLESELESLPEH